MANKASFTADEWKLLLEKPDAGGYGGHGR